jgi:uncharacterized membrane protein (UPF0127 family)
MKYAMLYDNGRLLDRVQIANTFLERLRGLMFQRNIKEGLLLCPCSQIHTYFMRESIDVVYLDRSGQVLSVETAMEPRKIGWYIHGSYCVLELPAHRWSQYQCGNAIEVRKQEEMAYVQVLG